MKDIKDMKDMSPKENPFYDLMKGHSNAALLVVVQTREQYQPAAVEAALAELAFRNISPEEIAQIEVAGQSALAARQHNLANRTRTKGRQLIARMNPFQYTGVEKDIAMIVVSISYYFIFLLLTGYDDLIESIRFFSLGAKSLLLMAPYILVPAGLYFFRKRDPLGWTILCAWVVYSLATMAALCLFFYRDYFFRARTEFVRSPVFNQRVDISSILLGVLIFSGMFYSLNRKHVREALRISSNWQWATILLTAGISYIIITML